MQFAGGSSTSQEMTSCDRRWPEVTWKWCHLRGSNLEVAVEGRKLEYTVHFTFYKAVAHRRRQLRDGNRRHVTWGDRKWPGSDVIWPKFPWNWQKAENSRILYISLPTRLHLQGEAVTWREMTSRDLMWP